MKTLARSALSIGAAAALLNACGGPQPPSASPAMPQTPATAPVRLTEHRIRPASSSYKVLYSFDSTGSDGQLPTAGLIDVNGTLYGTTSNGGTYGDGTVFSVSTTGTERVLYSFGSRGADAEYPDASLTYVNGMLYGTTYRGGEYDRGTVFGISTAGAEHVLHSFRGYPDDGAEPYASLIGVRGTLYGTTAYGGTYEYGYGTVFSITTAGAEHVLYSFPGTYSHGLYPFAGLLDVKGKGLYGTTAGYAFSGESSYAEGATVFSITTNGKIERVLYNFSDAGSGGNTPYASPTDVNGKLYGTTTAGGAHGTGAVFSIGTGGKNEHLLHSFGSGSDGTKPYASLIDVKGRLYGTTSDGGAYGYGTVFSMSTSGTERVLYSFGSSDSDGAHPYASLVYVNGTLYGTTLWGGEYQRGTVFALKLRD